MARIMKYEFIKNRFRYLIMAAILLLVEVGFLITNAASYHISSGMLLLLMVAAILVTGTVKDSKANRASL
ncbi:MAG: hypothetical protein PUC75_07380 [Lachnospiraceae bacterium]|nr:hypothetical protein [Lachnospiraceae bacterium]MDD6148606.1 hypothetical protein [Lachnospiraceae bacterium]